MGGETRVVILTGATSGIGAEVAKYLVARGWKVACVGRRKEAGDAVVASLGPMASFFQADISQYESQAKVFREVYRLWGRIDAFCPNAGIVDQSSFYLYDWQKSYEKGVDDIPPKPDLFCTDADYKGVIYGVQLARHFMKYNQPQPGGQIVVTSSVGGVIPHQSYPEYCGAKAAVNQFVRGIAPLLKQRENIWINCVLPGIVATPIVPREMIDAVTTECVTPMQTVIDAFDTFLEDTTGMAGEMLECSGNRLVFYPMPEPSNGKVTKRAVTVWEPLFRMMHGDDSRLEDAIP